MLEIYPELTSEEAKEDRRHLRVWIGRVVLLLVLLVTVATSTYAAETLRLKGPDGKDAVVIVLHEGKCTDKEVLAYLGENILDDRKFKKAHIEWEGVTFGGCWVEVNGNVHPIGSDRQPIRPVPRSAFKDEAV